MAPVETPAPAEEISEFELEVPANAHPGVTQLSFEPPGCDYNLLLGVPENWAFGDSLIVFRNANCQWQLKIVKHTEDEVRKEPRKVKFFIPAWAVPGESKFQIDAGCGEILNVVPPEFARPGDEMVFTYGENGWQGSMTKDKLTRSKLPNFGNLRDMRPWRAPPMDLDQNYKELVAAVRAAGGFFHPNLERASLPPLNIPGIIASGPIEEGEVVCRVPRRIQVSSQAANRIHPTLKAELESTEKMAEDMRIQRTDLAVLLAQLIFRAEVRAVARHNRGDVGFNFTDPLEGAAIDADVLKVWDSFADGLLATDLDSHVFLRVANDVEAVQAEFQPSTQADLIMDGAGNMNDTFDRIRSNCSASILGSAFDDAKIYAQAKFCMMTRVFDVNSSPAMVMLGDLFNHHSQYGIRWAYNEAEDAMDYVAIRPHAKGEEVFVSYGSTSNVKLHRGYGFTLPAQDEESWGYEMRRERVHSIMDAFVPEAQQLPVISLDTLKIDTTLSKLLNAVADNGSDPADFLSLACCRCKAEYDADTQMQPFLEALQRARAKRTPSCTWWEELSDDNARLASSDAIRVKMCEYLCLVTHIESVMAWQGMLPEESCLERAAEFRAVVADALSLLKGGSRIAIDTR
mmetsp:Transcript_126217/g.200187  ORF Transcript_126217/g.200187 Transcript_126217/m.200187 type:complete len:629 (+) Transcript_126217:58-1944(+)